MGYPQRTNFLGKLKEAAPISSAPKDLSPGTKNLLAESVSGPPGVKSAWKSVPMVEAESIQPKAKVTEKATTSPMKSIIADEQEKKRNLEKAKSKPLSLTLVLQLNIVS